MSLTTLLWSSLIGTPLYNLYEIFDPVKDVYLIEGKKTALLAILA